MTNGHDGSFASAFCCQAVEARSKVSILGADSGPGCLVQSSTALVHYAELPVFRGDQSMVAGDARIGHYQVLINFSSYGERSVIEIHHALLVPLHEYQDGEYPRAG